MSVAVGPDRERIRVLMEIERRRDEVIEHMVATIAGEIPQYRLHPDAELMRDLLDHVASNVDLFLRVAKAERAPTSAELVFIREAVEARIAQGFPIDHVLHAFRIGQRVLWETVMHEAAAVGAGPEAALSLALPAMQYTDAASSEFTERYVRLEQELRASSDRAGAEIVTALSEGRWPHDRSIAALRTPFPLHGAQAYVVAVALGSHEALEEIRRRANTIGASGSHFDGCVTQLSARDLVVIMALRTDAAEDAPAIMDGKLRQTGERLTACARIGVGGACVGIADIADSRHEATVAARQAELGGSVVFPALPLVERVALAASALGAPERLVPERLRGFVRSDLEGGATLTTTAEIYVECDLNTNDAAERLYLHPNTVRYRLGRVGSLTGLDVRSPRAMFELVTAVRILRAAQRPAAPGE
jgi:hypothetical protein